MTGFIRRHGSFVDLILEESNDAVVFRERVRTMWLPRNQSVIGYRSRGVIDTSRVVRVPFERLRSRMRIIFSSKSKSATPARQSSLRRAPVYAPATHIG